MGDVVFWKAGDGTADVDILGVEDGRRGSGCMGLARVFVAMLGEREG